VSYWLSLDMTEEFVANVGRLDHGDMSVVIDVLRFLDGQIENGHQVILAYLPDESVRSGKEDWEVRIPVPNISLIFEVIGDQRRFHTCTKHP